MEELIEKYRKQVEKITGINVDKAKSMVYHEWINDKYIDTVTFELEPYKVVLLCKPKKISMAIGSVWTNGAVFKVWENF